MHQQTITFQTEHPQCTIDITSDIELIVNANPGHSMAHIFARGATAAIFIQENWDTNISFDMLESLNRLVPDGQWRHDRLDDNGAAHIKSGIVGPSESIPIMNGKLMLTNWQNIFFVEFDGPRHEREIVVTLT